MFCAFTNYLIDTDHCVIVDVEGTRLIRRAEAGSERTILDRIKVQHDIDLERIIAPTRRSLHRLPVKGQRLWICSNAGAVGGSRHRPARPSAGQSGPDRWHMASHAPLLLEAMANARLIFEWDAENNRLLCPEGESLRQFQRNYSDPNRKASGKGVAKYQALKQDCHTFPGSSL